jgi:Na+/H+-dicarboxylate symporter
LKFLTFSTSFRNIWVDSGIWLVHHGFCILSHVIIDFAKVNPIKFFKAIAPAQLLAFSTSSSAATLPVTMVRTENVGVDEEVSSFVLPLGATVNMDGTSLYQAVAAIL